MSIEDGFSSHGALYELRRGMVYYGEHNEDTTTDCEDCEKRIRMEERKKILHMIIEGEPTIHGRRVTLERIYNYVVGTKE